jgi:heme/copper-type cytochrome/quinol oxidase subunit 4
VALLVLGLLVLYMNSASSSSLLVLENATLRKHLLSFIILIIMVITSFFILRQDFSDPIIFFATLAGAVLGFWLLIVCLVILSHLRQREAQRAKIINIDEYMYQGGLTLIVSAYLSTKHKDLRVLKRINTIDFIVAIPDTKSHSD